MTLPELVSKILWLHFHTVGESGDTSAIFVCVCTDIMLTVDQKELFLRVSIFSIYCSSDPTKYKVLAFDLL